MAQNHQPVLVSDVSYSTTDVQSPQPAGNPAYAANHGDHGNHASNGSQNHGQNRQPKRGHRKSVKESAGGLRLTGIDVEHLEDADWREHPWVAPNIKRAQKMWVGKMFEGGEGKACVVGTKELGAMGVGISLYFRMLKYLTVVFLIMSIIAIPYLIICYEGERVSDQDVDPLYLSFFSLGNVGRETDVNFNATACAATYGAGADECNQDKINVLGRELEITTAANIIMATDLVNTLFFLCFILFFRMRILTVEGDTSTRYLTTSDYAVMVQGLPADCKEEDVLRHFNNLYDLDKKDWTWTGDCCLLFCRRKSRPREDVRLPTYPEFMETNRNNPRFRGRKSQFDRVITELGQPRMINKPVLNATNSGDPQYLRTWIADVSLALRDHGVIRKYLKRRKLFQQLRLVRARVKKYDRGSKYHDAKKLAKAEKKLAKMDKKIEKFGRRHASKVTDEVVCAFVTFNCEESLRRCLEDYHNSQSFWYRMIHPPPLKFKHTDGKLYPLSVQHAPEPSNILWENLDTSKAARCCRQFLVGVALAFIMVASLIVMFIGQREQANFADQVPALSYCERELPAAAFGTYDLPEDYFLKRTESAEANCPSDTFHITYESIDMASTSWNASYAEQVAQDKQDNPSSVKDLCLDACVPAAGGRSCDTYTPDLESYRLSTRMGCYCVQVLKDVLKTKGIFSAGSELKDKHSDTCLTFATNYVIGQGLLIAAACVVVVVNFALKGTMKCLTRCERLNSISEESTSVAVKIFFAQWINTAFIILIVNAKWPSDDNPFSGIGLFAGEFDSVDPRWYTVVGVSIVLTMLLNTISPHLAPCFRLIFVRSFMKWEARTDAITQEQINRAYEPARFEVEERYPLALNTLFVTMFYSGGLPLLLPFAAFSFFMTFWIDKLSLLWLYRKPPHLNSSFARFAATIMPLAVILHLGLTIWMYGDDEAIKSDLIDPGLVEKYAGVDIQEKYDEYVARLEEDDPIDIAPKIIRTNVFPLAVLLALMLLWYILKWIMKRFFRPLFQRCLTIVSCGCCGSFGGTSFEARRPEYNPPFTGPFEEQLRPQTNPPRPNPRELKAGWRLIRDDSRGPQATSRIRVWPKDTRSVSGILHKQGDRMRTWEVIQHYSIASYNIIKNPKYSHAFAAMKDTAEAYKRQRTLAKCQSNPGLAVQGESPGALAYTGGKTPAVTGQPAFFPAGAEPTVERIPEERYTSMTDVEGGHLVQTVQVDPMGQSARRYASNNQGGLGGSKLNNSSSIMMSAEPGGYDAGYDDAYGYSGVYEGQQGVVYGGDEMAAAMDRQYVEGGMDGYEGYEYYDPEGQAYTDPSPDPGAQPSCPPPPGHSPGPSGGEWTSPNNPMYGGGPNGQGTEHV